MVLDDLRAVPVRPASLGGIELKADLRESVWYPLWRYGHYPHQAGAELVLRNVLSHDSLVFDVGANIGYLSLFFALHCSRGMVVAFEPSPRARKFLQLAAAQVPNIRVEAFALSDHAGEATFCEAPQLDRSGLGTGARGFRVPLMTVDMYCSSTGLWPDFLKIDTEGHDDKVCVGAREALATSVRHVMFEALDRRSLAACIAALQKSGRRWCVYRVGHEGCLSACDGTDYFDKHAMTNNYLAERH
jgi:FkbM family methyltransferase